MMRPFMYEIWISDKMKMDRRFFLMQNIKVRQSHMKKIYDQLLHGRKLQMFCGNKGNIIDIITNLTHGINNYG